MNRISDSSFCVPQSTSVRITVIAHSRVGIAWLFVGKMKTYISDSHTCRMPDIIVMDGGIFMCF